MTTKVVFLRLRSEQGTGRSNNVESAKQTSTTAHLLLLLLRPTSSLLSRGDGKCDQLQHKVVVWCCKCKTNTFNYMKKPR